MKITTLCILTKPNYILLAMKKRGFGIGKWNGVGGKVQQGESIEDAVIREAFEEIGVKINKKDLNKVAIHHFSFINKSDWDQDVHVYFSSKWKEQPIESEEMKPQWYKIDEIPFEKMWPDDIHWLPRALKGEKIRGHFSFNENQVLQDGFKLEELVE